MLACAAIGYLLGRSRGMGLQGFFLGLAFGPIGWGLVLLWPRSWIQGPVPRERETGFRGPPRPESPGRRDSRRPGGYPPGEDAGGPRSGIGAGCPRCGSPVARGAGACPRCGNVLVPIRYRVNPGGS